MFIICVENWRFILICLFHLFVRPNGNRSARNIGIEKRVSFRSAKSLNKFHAIKMLNVHYIGAVTKCEKFPNVA